MSAVGVDFGYSSIRLAVFRDENEERVSNVEIVENDLGSRQTPTVVAFDESARLIGVEAINHAALNPKDAVFNLKKLIGLPFKVLEDQILKNCDFDYENSDGRLMIRRTASDNGYQLFTAEQLLALIFLKLKEYTESVEIKFQKVVISVPMYFSQNQREALTAATAIADIEVKDLIPNTTAVAINYIWDKLDSKYGGNCKLFVFSFGASSLEVALIDVCDYELNVGATHSSILGGVDFDNRLIDLCVERFKKHYNVDVNLEKRLMHKLRIQCQKAKITLQTKSDARVILDVGDEDLVTVIKRDKFNEICDDLFTSVKETVEKLFNSVNCDRNQINEVILVGGSSRLKKVETFLAKFFKGKKMNRRLQVDEAVVNGASIFAAMSSRVKDAKVNQIRIRSNNYDCNGFIEPNGYRSLSEEDIIAFRDELRDYKNNCLTEYRKAMLKNDVHSGFFDLKRYFQLNRKRLNTEDSENMESDIKSFSERIDVKDSPIDYLLALKNDIQDKRAFIDTRLQTLISEEKSRTESINEQPNATICCIQIDAINQYSDAPGEERHDMSVGNLVPLFLKTLMQDVGGLVQRASTFLSNIFIPCERFFTYR